MRKIHSDVNGAKQRWMVRNAWVQPSLVSLVVVGGLPTSTWRTRLQLKAPSFFGWGKVRLRNFHWEFTAFNFGVFLRLKLSNLFQRFIDKVDQSCYTLSTLDSWALAVLDVRCVSCSFLSFFVKFNNLFFQI